MKNRHRILTAVGICVLSITIPVSTACAEDILEENDVFLEEDIGGDSGTEASETTENSGASQDAPAAGTIVIESIETVPVQKQSGEEAKAVKELAKSAQKREESRKEKAKNSPITGFHVNPLDYPPANITENTCRIYSYLTEELGMNHAAACGVIANIHLESSFFPLALGDGGTSYGICQWHLGRFNGLIAFCNANGLDYNTLEGQLCYLKYELETGYAGVLSYLQKVPDTKEGAYDAAYYWCIGFEKPDDMHYRGVRRGNLAANEYYARDFMRPENTSDESGAEEMPRLMIDSAAAGFCLPELNVYAQMESACGGEVSWVHQ